MQTINERMKWVLEHEKLNLKQASERAEIPYRSLQNYISGSQTPGADALAKFHSTFKVDLNWLVSGVGENPYAMKNTLASQEIDSPLSEQIITALKKYIPAYFDHAETRVMLKVFPMIYNQVCHMLDSDERAVSIKKAIGFYLAGLHDDMVNSALSELNKANLSQDERDSHKLIIESGLRGKAKVLERHGLKGEQVATNAEVNQTISGSNHQIAGRDLVNKDKS